MNSEKAYHVLIIGAGNIGAFFDTPGSLDVLTHAHAFKLHRGYELIGFVDSVYDRANSAAKIWDCSAFASIKDAFDSHSIDVVSVCVPDELHYQVIMELMNYPVKLIFSEKPLTKKLEDAEHVMRFAEEKNIAFIVNYSRRFVTEIAVLKRKIEAKEFGEYIAGNGYYGKGVLHNGSHMIELMQALIGEITHSNELSGICDYYPDDPTVSSVLWFKNSSKFFLQGVDCNLYTIFEMDMLFEKARVRLIDSGFALEEYSVKSSDRFSGYQMITHSTTKETDLGKAMQNAIKHIYRVLRYNEPIVCSANDAYSAMRIAVKMLGQTKQF